jgi:hypothetical protein
VSEQRNVQLIEQTSKSIKAWTLVGAAVSVLGPLLGLALGDVRTMTLLAVVGFAILIGSGLAKFWNRE